MIVYAGSAIWQEHDAIPGGEASFSAFNGDAHVLAQIASLTHPVAGGFVEFPHLGVGMGEDDAAAVRCGLPIAVPAVDQA